MKKILINCLTLMTIIAVMTTNFATVAQAQTGESKKERELAKQLEFIFEKASKKDSSGEIVGFDIEMIEEKYGKSPELNALKEIQKQNNLKQKTDQKKYQFNSVSPSAIIWVAREEFNECMSDEMTSFLGSFVATTTIASFYQELKNGEYLKGAKSLMKVTGKTAVKGGVYGLAAQLTWATGKCGWKTGF
ncbi:hypothetical protein [Saliterribacillus persicus]|uniref:Uncharacterized protein n=1 Tax=Saliterribacillus persicus TaxID=930114 RepID=A0A368X6C2_9BACI|nr:hypothetical protein [Saliterribacillus persicus]RCW63375.1 hypothetical protein DFR57_11842 [Saliterribacillus persicus]